jgi:Ser/Thr protein kinase RdoA (MazF antagonist)
VDYSPEYVEAIARNFKLEGEITSICRYGSGRINETFLVTLLSGQEKQIILQRINNLVFPHPEWVMSNMRAVTDHIHGRLRQEQKSNAAFRWEVPRILLAEAGKYYFVDSDGYFWRAMDFIDASVYEKITDINQARAVGFGLGRFHSLISDLSITRLYDTLEGFHVTPRYLDLFDNAEKSKSFNGRFPEVKYCLEFVEKRRRHVSVLEDAKRRNELILRPIHGDPKYDNIMIDKKTGQAVSIIDLDTVKPGIVHYDIGDCIRSCCNLAGEETKIVNNVHFRSDLCRAVLQGYLSAARNFLGNNDYAYLYDAIRLIPFELGLRFFTDYLEGDVYFKVKNDKDNLMRALVQFRLTESIESQEAEIRRIIDDLR